MADVMLNLIDPLEARYNWGDVSPDAVILRKRDMADAFKHHAIEDLKEATRQIVLTRRYSTMPSVADVKLILDALAEKRKAAAAPQKTTRGWFGTYDEWRAAQERERLAAQEWARDWLRTTPLGKEALREGWARPLHGLIWQIKLNRDRAGKSCGFDDIKLDDIATQTAHGAKLIDYFRANCRNFDAEFERKLVLKERFA